MQELLPFGEYVSPEQTQSAQNVFMGQFEAWELERILARLAVSNAGPGLNQGRRRGHLRAEPVNGELLSGIAGTAYLPDCACKLDYQQFSVSLAHHTSVRAVDRPVAEAGSSSGQQSGVPSNQAAVSAGTTDEALYPSSWPPHSGRGKPQVVVHTYMSPVLIAKPTCVSSVVPAKESHCRCTEVTTAAVVQRVLRHASLCVMYANCSALVHCLANYTLFCYYAVCHSTKKHKPSRHAPATHCWRPTQECNRVFQVTLVSCFIKV